MWLFSKLGVRSLAAANVVGKMASALDVTHPSITSKSSLGEPEFYIQTMKTYKADF